MVREFDEDDGDGLGEGTAWEDEGVEEMERDEDAEDDELLLGSKVRDSSAFFGSSRPVLFHLLRHVTRSWTRLTFCSPSHCSRHCCRESLCGHSRKHRRLHRNSLELARGRSSWVLRRNGRLWMETRVRLTADLGPPKL